MYTQIFYEHHGASESWLYVKDGMLRYAWEADTHPWDNRSSTEIMTAEEAIRRWPEYEEAIRAATAS